MSIFWYSFPNIICRCWVCKHLKCSEIWQRCESSSDNQCTVQMIDEMVHNLQSHASARHFRPYEIDINLLQNNPVNDLKRCSFAEYWRGFYVLNLCLKIQHSAFKILGDGNVLLMLRRSRVYNKLLIAQGLCCQDSSNLPTYSYQTSPRLDIEEVSRFST